jgi:hypothetical protein
MPAFPDPQISRLVGKLILKLEKQNQKGPGIQKK